MKTTKVRIKRDSVVLDCKSSTTESGITLYEKSETDKFFEELEKCITVDEFGDSDTNANGNTDRYNERRTTTVENVRVTDGELNEMVENEYREKSPGFEDFFRVNDDNDDKHSNYYLD